MLKSEINNEVGYSDDSEGERGREEERKGYS